MTRSSLTCLSRISRLLPVLLFAMPAPVNAIDVYWQPHAQVGVGYDDNFRLLYDGQDIDESILSQGQADAELGIDNGKSKSTLYGRYWSQLVSSDSDYNADIKELRWNFQNNSEKSQFTLNAGAQYDTTLTSEFDDSGLFLNQKKDRHAFHGGLGYRQQLSPLNYVSGDISTDAIRYIDAKDVRLSDYDSTSVTLNFGHAVSERTNVGVQVAYSEFEIPETLLDSTLSRESETKSVMVAFFGDYAISERDSLNLQAGFRDSNIYDEYSVPGFGLIESSKEESKGRVFTAGYSRKFEASSLYLSASRDLRPNSSGAVSEQDNISVALQNSFSERLSLSVTLSANRQHEPVRRSLSSGAQNFDYDREYAQFVAGLHYSISQQHSLAIEVNERWQQIDTGNDIEAKSTALYLRWYWNPPHKEL